MKMLHAFSENGTGDIDVQMNHLIERVVLMQERADVLRSEERAFRMKLIFAYPVLAATGKLLADLTVGMAVDDAGSWRHGRCVSEIYHRSIQCDAGAGF